MRTPPVEPSSTLPFDPSRRGDAARQTDAEHAISEAILRVEAMTGDTRLDRALALLQIARDEVADFVDGVEKPATVSGKLKRVSEAILALACEIDD